MEFTLSPAYYIRRYTEAGLPHFTLSVVALDDRPGCSWFEAKLTQDPQTGPVIGTARVSIRMEDESRHDPISGRTTTTSYTVCEIETLIADAVCAADGYTAVATKQTFRPLTVKARVVNVFEQAAFGGRRPRKQRFGQPEARQATWDDTGRYIWRMDWSLF